MPLCSYLKEKGKKSKKTKSKSCLKIDRMNKSYKNSQLKEKNGLKLNSLVFSYKLE